MKKNTYSSKKIAHKSYIFIFAFALLFGSAGAAFLRYSQAEYDHSPVGFIDYCLLQNNRTNLYGWAADPDVAAGSLPTVTLRMSNGHTVTVNSGISGYRDAEINAHETARGAPTSGTYGFKFDLGTLYKGNNHGLGGTINNVGQGANSELVVNDFKIINGSPNFPGKKIPDVCLANVPPPAPPRPPSTPPPVPRPPAAAPAALSTKADAIVTTGTVVTSLQIPNGNAEKMRVMFGTNEQSPDQATEIQDISPDATTVFLKNLDPVTTYYYKIIRLKNDNTSAESPVSSFKTLGLDVVLTFLNGEEKVSGIDAKIDSLEITGTSDENGTTVLKQVPEGIHNLTFSHGGKDYQREIAVTPEDVHEAALAEPIVGMVEVSVQLKEEIDENIVVEPTGKGGIPIWLIIILLVAAIGSAVFWFIKKRNRGNDDFDNSFQPSDLMPMQPPPPPITYAPPQPPANPAQVTHPTQPPAAHPGESLKDLVLKSMREEAVRKQAEQNNKPPTPPVAP